jgi:putative heme degradation protein
MKRKFFVMMSAVAFAMLLTIGGHAQSKTVNLENLSANKTETQVYDKKGKLVYSVYRYDATELPADVKSLVRSEYYDYDIAGVEEVQTPGDASSIYFVYVQNDSKLKIVRVYNGETELVKEYKRG